MADLTTACVKDLQDKVKNCLKPEDGIKDNLFYIYDQDTLLNLAEGLCFPCAGVSYESLRAVGRSGDQAEIACGIIVLSGAKSSENINSDDKPGITLMLDRVRQAINKTLAPSGYPWRFHAEVPLNIAETSLGYYQQWRATVATSGAVLGTSGQVMLNTLALPVLVIENEFGWTGLVTEVSQLLGGFHGSVQDNVWLDHPMDLVGSEEPNSYIDRLTLKQLHAMAQDPNATHTLTYGTRTFTVRFRGEDAPVISAIPVVPKVSPDDSDLYYDVRIKLLATEEL